MPLFFFFLYTHLSAEPQSPCGRKGQRIAEPLSSPGSCRALSCCGAPPWETPPPTSGLQKSPHRSHSSSSELPQLSPMPLYSLDTSKNAVPGPWGQPGSTSWPLLIRVIMSPLSPVSGSYTLCLTKSSQELVEDLKHIEAINNLHCCWS